MRALLPLLATCLTGSVLLLLPERAAADASQLRVLPQSELRFGRFAVPARGSIEVGPTGAVSREGIISISPGDTSPARFVVRYDRGNNGRARLDLRIQLVVSPPQTFTRGGITASLSAFRTDLPGYPSVSPGQVVEINIPNCRQRVCEAAFNLGGRLDVDRAFGGGPIAIPIPVDVLLVSVR